MSTAQQERTEAARLPDDDIIGVLLTQHARIRDLFSEVRNSTGDRRREKFDELRALLAVHETAEEMILRPVSKKAAGEEQAEARNEEEREANEVLADLEKMDLGSEDFRKAFADFEQSVSDHADHEERAEFPAIRRECTAEEREKMGKRLLSVERFAPTHPHPSAAGSTTAQWTAGPFAALIDRVKDAVRKSSPGD